MFLLVIAAVIFLLPPALYLFFLKKGSLKHFIHPYDEKIGMAAALGVFYRAEFLLVISSYLASRNFWTGLLVFGCFALYCWRISKKLGRKEREEPMDIWEYGKEERAAWGSDFRKMKSGKPKEILSFTKITKKAVFLNNRVYVTKRKQIFFRPRPLENLSFDRAFVKDGFLVIAHGFSGVPVRLFHIYIPEGKETAAEEIAHFMNAC